MQTYQHSHSTHPKVCQGRACTPCSRNSSLPLGGTDTAPENNMNVLHPAIPDMKCQQGTPILPPATTQVMVSEQLSTLIEWENGKAVRAKEPSWIYKWIFSDCWVFFQAEILNTNLKSANKRSKERKPYSWESFVHLHVPWMLFPSQNKIQRRMFLFV